MTKINTLSSDIADSLQHVASARSMGFPSLPLELFHEVLSHFPEEIPFPIAPRSARHPFLEAPLRQSSARLQRTQVLRSLAQTCKTLRRFALEHAWDRIEVVSIADEKIHDKGCWERELARELMRQIEVTTARNPSLAGHVRTITAIVTSHSSKAIAQGLRKCFDLFPNLHTVQLLSLLEAKKRPDSAHYWEAFGYGTPSFHSIRRLVLPSYAGVLLKCCPALEVAVATLHPEWTSDFDNGRRMLSDLFEGCVELKELEGFPIWWGMDFDRIIVSFPKLNTLCINSFNTGWDLLPTPEQISRLRYLPLLRNISIHIGDLSERGEIRGSEQQCIVSLCLWIIASSPNPVFPDPPAPTALQEEYASLASLGPAVSFKMSTERQDYLLYAMTPPHIRNSAQKSESANRITGANPSMPWGVTLSEMPSPPSLTVYSYGWYKFVKFQPTQYPWDPQKTSPQDSFIIRKGRLTQDEFEEPFFPK